MVSDDNWMAVLANLRKARKEWERLSQILGWEGTDPRTSGTFYNAVVWDILIFGANTFVNTS